MDQTLVLENSDLEVNPSIENDHIPSDDHHHESEIFAHSAASHGLIELSSSLLERDTLTQIPLPHDNNTEDGSQQPINNNNNTQNGTEFTVLNLLNQHPPKNNEEKNDFPPKNTKNKFCPNSHLLLTCSICVAGSTYTSIFNLNLSYTETTQSISFGEIILCPERLPNSFYILMFMSIAFTMSMVGIGVALRSMIRASSSCSRALLFLCLLAFFFSYAFTIRENVPKFWVTIESFNFEISSFWLVWLYGLSVFLPPLALLLVVKLVVALVRLSNC